MRGLESKPSGGGPSVMKLLFLKRKPSSLYATLMKSETSRNALRFYRPAELPCGVLIEMASLGSALSLTGELRWYVRRYMLEALFGITSGVYCTYALAREVYDDRCTVLADTWQFSRLYRFREGRLVSRERIDAGRNKNLVMENDGIVDLVVWCSEGEYLLDTGVNIPEPGSGACPDEEESDLPGTEGQQMSDQEINSK